jgi:7-cyano-7-deazaguanine reductase
MAEHIFGADIQLGREQAYSDQYDPSLLQPIARVLCRQQLPIHNFFGEDIWTGYELSWLDDQGKPHVCALEFIFPADSSHLIESKSFKYYLNSFNQTRMPSQPAVLEILTRDLSAAAGGLVSVRPYLAPSPTGLPDQFGLDHLPLIEPTYCPAPEYLSAGQEIVSQILCSDLLKTNCPVTGQPDWASIWIGYEGGIINPAGMLAYIVSYRQQQDFHENCVEQIFCDIWQRCAPSRLWVYARYTRRGGLDINPFRSSHPLDTPALRGFRQ